jgi:hypothetical protein
MLFPTVSRIDAPEIGSSIDSRLSRLVPNDVRWATARSRTRGRGILVHPPQGGNRAASVSYPS